MYLVIYRGPGLRIEAKPGILLSINIQYHHCLGQLIVTFHISHCTCNLLHTDTDTSTDDSVLN